jgi:uncharacterized protein
MPEADFKIDIVELEKKPDFKGYTLIKGFPGPGLIGIICTKFLAEKLKMQVFAYIDSDVFMPIVRIHEGKPEHPARFYLDEKNKLIVLVVEQAIPKDAIYWFAKKIADWTRKKGISKIISLSGMQKAKANILGIGANNKSVDFLKKNGIELIQDGITTGISAILLDMFEEKDVILINLLAPAEIETDYTAASENIKVLAKMLGLEIETAPLIEEAKKIKKELDKHMKEFGSTVSEEEQSRMYG